MLGVIIVASLIILPTLRAPAAEEAAAKPVLVVFDLDNPPEQGELGHAASVKILAKADREQKFVIIEPMDVESTLQSTGFRPKAESNPAEVLAFAKKHFAADTALWGHAERNSDGSITLQVRAYRLQDEAVTAVLDQAFVAPDRYHLSETAERIVALLAERPAPTPVDAAKLDLNWKYRSNLVRNGNFELGKDGPLYWQQLEPRMSWVKEPGHGHVLKFDIPQAIAETYGFDFYSDFIDVDDQATYRFSVDIRSLAPAAIIFLKGYALFPPGEGEKESQWREVYRYQRKTGSPADWTTVTLDFHPTIRGYRVQKLKVDLYAYYPPGVVFFDNVVIKKVSP